jgi:uncharacterized protein
VRVNATRITLTLRLTLTLARMKLGRGATIAIIIVGLFLLLVGGKAVAGFLVEMYWYRSLDLESVFWRQWRATVFVRGSAAVAIAAAVVVNLWLVTRTLGAIRVRRRYANIEIAERLPQAYVVAAISFVALFSCWWLSAGLADPLPVLAAFNPELWNLSDPVFGFDAAFYVFQLPLLNRLQTLGALLVFWVSLLAIAAYVATGAIKVVEGKLAISPLARRHIGLLAAAFIALYAVNLWLDRYGLVVSGNGFGEALGYTDVHARMPAKVIVGLLALAAAGAIGYGSWIGSPRLPVAASILLFIGLVSGEIIYPSSIQRFVVEPNQFPREEQYIQDHLEFARHAYGLDSVELVPLPYDDRTSFAQTTLEDRLRGIPLWDPRPLLTTYRQQQALLPYYTFNSVHHDRYGSGADAEPIAVSVRELETQDLEAAAQTWENVHIRYVNGEGAVVSPVATMAADGTPAFYVWDNPPKLGANAPPGVGLTQPNIYFGERTRDYAILDGAAEPIGIALTGVFRKALFA